jgi:hypothetical protein
MEDELKKKWTTTSKKWKATSTKMKEKATSIFFLIEDNLNEKINLNWL